MIAKAHIKYLKVSPKKANRIVPLIKGKNVEVALGILSSLNKGASLYFRKALNSAISNAQQKGVEKKDLYISLIKVDAGPALRRYRAATFGRATLIKRRTSHIKVELDLLNK